MKLDVGRWRRLRGMERLLDALSADTGETRFVGGTVRDALLEQEGGDIDLATRLDPAEVVRRLEASGIKAIPTGIEHGTVTAISEGLAVEVTTLRRDVATDGRRATVAFTDRWEEDASRRDFTFNALYADAVSGAIHDYTGGVTDLREGRVRFIGEPLRRIAEDHLRILRYFRFHARFGRGEPDSQALQACTERANDLMALSRERIADELLKLLALPDPSASVGLMIDRGIFNPVIPEIGEDSALALTGLVAAERGSGVPSDPLRRLAALLPPDPQTADRVAARLKLSNKARKRLTCAADRNDARTAKEMAYRLGLECAVDRLLLSGRSDDAPAIAGWDVPSLPVGGGELIARGLEPGPRVARLLRAIEDRWVAEGFPGRERVDSILAEALSGNDGA